MKDLVLKHDGYIHGSFTHAIIRGEEPSTSIECRFVSKSIFDVSPSIPHQFLIDLKQRYNSFDIEKSTITCGSDTYTIRVHGVADELKFVEECDFTCNLLDYRRDGLFLRYVPRCIAYECSPYETVIEHIQKKLLVPVNTQKALENVKKYIDLGWSSECVEYGDHECPICGDTDNETLYFKLPCGHWGHVTCLKKWVLKNPTCPMCRKHV